MTSKEFLRRAKALAKKRGDALSTLSRVIFPGNPRALARLEKAVLTRKGGPPWVEAEDAVPRLEKLEAEAAMQNGR